MLAEYLANSVLLWAHFSLLSLSFQLASTGCRHFNFTIGFGFLIAPYVAFSVVRLGVGFGYAVALGLLASVATGILYYMLSVWSYRRGSRPGQLLLVSLAALGIGENAIALAWGSSSIKLPNYDFPFRWLGLPDGLQFALLIFILFGLFWKFWRTSLLGSLTLALNESRLALRLRGYNVEAVECTISTLGFFLAGLEGMLWGLDMRVNPMLGFEICLIGIVAYIAGPLFSKSPAGLLLASLCIVAVRLPLVLLVNGDWEMTPPLLVLLIALGTRYARTARLMLYRLGHALLHALPHRPHS